MTTNKLVKCFPSLLAEFLQLPKSGVLPCWLQMVELLQGIMLSNKAKLLGWQKPSILGESSSLTCKKKRVSLGFTQVFVEN
jgi:hypothetical protein